MRRWRKRSPERTRRGERGSWPNKGLLRLQKGRNNRTTRKNGKSNNKVDIVRGPKLPVDVACCRIVRERISPPPLCSYSPVAPRIFLVDVQVSAMSVVHHHYHRRCRRRRRRHHFLLFFLLFLPRPRLRSSPLRPPPFLAGGTWLPGRRSVHTLVLEQPPRLVFSGVLPCPTLPFSLRSFLPSRFQFPSRRPLHFKSKPRR